MAGLRVELAVDAPSVCPVAEASEAARGAVRGVSRTGRKGRVVEEFRAELPDRAGGGKGGLDVDGAESVERIFDYGPESVYRLERDGDDACLCEVVESLDCPVADVRAEDGTLLLTLHLADADRFREVVGTLRERGESVSVRYLVRTAEDEGTDSVVVDRSRLTDRQAEVLETARGMGYFEYPRESNATEVADELGIEPSTFAEHLAAAQSKLLEQCLE
ncbi:MAG: helix-turn-helix domain-containing protein [Haloferacaceae archaeon]